MCFATQMKNRWQREGASSHTSHGFISFSSVQFSHSVMSDSLQPTARQASLSITNSRSLPKFMSIESVMPSNHLILCHHFFLLPSIFPSIRVFSNESALRIRWPKYWSFSFNISPTNQHPGLISFRMDWLDLLAVQGTLKSLLQLQSSKASILLRSAFFIVQLSHPYMTTGKTIALMRLYILTLLHFLVFLQSGKIVSSNFTYNLCSILVNCNTKHRTVSLQFNLLLFPLICTLGTTLLPYVTRMFMKLKENRRKFTLNVHPSRLLCPWDFPGKSTGAGSHSFSKGSSPPRDRTWVSWIIGRFFTNWATREAHTVHKGVIFKFLQ